MAERGYEQEFAEQIFKQILGFGDYGFPESHAYSFALLAYVSSWLKCHEPAIFLAALLNSQPMGFYAPSQLVQDARRHGVEVRPVDVLRERLGLHARAVGADGGPQPAVRLGLRMVHRCREATAKRLVAARRRTRLRQHRRPRPPRRHRHPRAAGAGPRRRAAGRWPATAGNRPGSPPARSCRRALLARRADQRSGRSLCRRRPKASKSCSTTPRSA